jgi:hypothetical protein
MQVKGKRMADNTPATEGVPAQPIALGTTIRANIGGNPYRIGGYLMRFWPEDKRDTYMTYFDADTNYRLDDYRIPGMPMLFQHGLDKRIGIEPVGRFDTYRMDEWGIWVEGLLDERRQYINYIQKMVEQGAFDFSGRCLDESLIINERTGHVDQWCFIEGSLTHTPGDWRSVVGDTGTRIQPLRALVASLPPIEASTPTETDAAHETAGVTEAPGIDAAARAAGDILLESNIAQPAEDAPAPDAPHKGGQDMTREEISALVVELLAQAGITVPPAEQAAAEEAAAAEYAAMGSPEAVGEAEVQRMVNVALRSINAKKEQRSAAITAALETARAAQPTAPSPVEAAGAFRANGGKSATAPRISVGEDMRFARYDTSTLLLAAELQKTNMRKAGIEPETVAQAVAIPRGCEDAADYRDAYVRTVAGRIQRDIFEKPVIRREDELRTTRAALSFRANEVDNIGNTGYGLEWLGVSYGAIVWEKAREDLFVYDALVQAGLNVEEIGPNGSAKFFTEGADPTVYTARQSNNLDSTGRPEVTVNINPFGTGVVTLTPGEWKLAASYTVNLEEDTPIAIASQVDKQFRAKLSETIEQGMINGDTATAANTNINLIDDTPGTGLSMPYYLAFNGFLKLCLVTNTAQSRSASALDIRQFLLTQNLMPDTVKSKLANLVHIVDANTYISALPLAEHATDDVRRAGGTFTDGKFTEAWGVKVIRTGMMVKANSAGKVPAAGGTLGRDLLVYAPYWGFAFKRQITIESDRDILSGANVYVGSVRAAMTPFNNTASAVTYNIPLLS